MKTEVQRRGDDELRSRAEAVAQGCSTLLPPLAYRKLVDGIVSALRDVSRRGEGCQPLHGEPSFVLLARDPHPQALNPKIESPLSRRCYPVSLAQRGLVLKPPLLPEHGVFRASAAEQASNTTTPTMSVRNIDPLPVR